MERFLATVPPWYHPAFPWSLAMTAAPDARPEPPHGGKPEARFQIQIDRVHYTVTKSQMTGAELRRVPPTPIGPERDLFEVVPGQPDRKIGDADIVQIHNGQRFFTAPGQINPGRVA